MREREIYDVRNLEQFTHWRRILHELNIRTILLVQYK